jgi:hypothetical protein
MSGLAINWIRIEQMDAAAPPASLITLPIVLIALLKFTEFNVQLCKARDGSSTWYFRFARNTILQVSDDGAWSWSKGPEPWRRRIEPILAQAEALLAAPAYDDALPGAGNA